MSDYASRRREGVSRRMRLKGHDYSEPGYYFLTVTVNGGHRLFGGVQDGWFTPHPAGSMIIEEWFRIAARFRSAEWDAYCVMPNHFHAIVGIGNGTLNARQTCSIPNIMQAFKSRTTMLYGQGVRRHGWSPYSGKLWHSGYYDHIVRTEQELARIRDYIESNPSNWNEDRFF